MGGCGRWTISMARRARPAPSSWRYGSPRALRPPCEPQPSVATARALSCGGGGCFFCCCVLMLARTGAPRLGTAWRCPHEGARGPGLLLRRPLLPRHPKLHGPVRHLRLETPASVPGVRRPGAQAHASLRLCLWRLFVRSPSPRRSPVNVPGDPKVAGEWRNKKLTDDPVKESNKRVSAMPYPSPPPRHMDARTAHDELTHSLMHTAFSSPACCVFPRPARASAH